MATNRWLGRARNVKQVNTITPANVNIGNTFTVTINGKNITYTAAAATVADVTAGLVALLTASTVFEEFKEITFADAVTHVTATANEAGKPFTQTSSASGGTATNVTATTTANVSANDVNNANNWSDGVPDAADDVVIENTSSSLLWNLDALAAIALTSLRISSTFTGHIGLAQDNGNYDEYRPQYFQILATTVKIGEGVGQGSQRIKVNLGATQAAITVYSSGRGVNGLPAVLLRGTHASNVLEAYGNAEVGVAVLAGETSTIATLSVADSASVMCGSGVTLATTKVGGRGAQLVTETTITTATITKEGGRHKFLLGTGAGIGVGNVTTLHVHGGVADYRGTGTIATANVRDGGELTFAADSSARTITNMNLYAGAIYRDPFQSVTWANPIAVETSLDKVTLDIGSDFLLQRS